METLPKNKWILYKELQERVKLSKGSIFNNLKGLEASGDIMKAPAYEVIKEKGRLIECKANAIAYRLIC